MSEFGVLLRSAWYMFCSLPLGVRAPAGNIVGPWPKAGVEASEKATELGGEKGDVADDGPESPCDM